MSLNRSNASFSGLSFSGMSHLRPQHSRLSMDPLTQTFHNTPRQSFSQSNGRGTPDSPSTTSEPRRRLVRPSLLNTAASNETTNPSADEIIIKSRGRRSLPLKWSPIPTQSPQKLPQRTQPGVISPVSKKGLITLRSTPRKRLLMNDTSNAELIQSRKSLFGQLSSRRSSLTPDYKSSFLCPSTETTKNETPKTSLSKERLPTIAADSNECKVEDVTSVASIEVTSHIPESTASVNIITSANKFHVPSKATEEIQK